MQHPVSAYVVQKAPASKKSRLWYNFRENKELGGEKLGLIVVLHSSLYKALRSTAAATKYGVEPRAVPAFLVTGRPVHRCPFSYPTETNQVCVFVFVACGLCSPAASKGGN